MTVSTGGAGRRRRLGAVGVAVLAILTLVMTILAVMDKGYAGSEVKAHDGGVWVTNDAEGKLGRINVDAREFDARIAVRDVRELLQSGSVVLLRTDDGLSRVNPASQRVEGRVELGSEDDVLLGGDRVVIKNAKGQMWILTPDQAAAFDPAALKPTKTFDSGDSLATVTTGGTVHVLQGGELTTFPYSATTQGIKAKEPVKVDGVSGQVDDLAMTAVGEEPVILDRTSGTLYVGSSGKEVDLASAGVRDAKDAVLQQPSLHGDGVLLATPDSLYDVPLDGGKATRDKTTGKGSPVAPVRAAGCAYAAWNGSNTYVTHCEGATPQQDRVEGATAQSRLALRVNHELVVLNDPASGRSWMIADDMQIVDTWVVTQPLDVKEQVEKEKETLTSTVVNVAPDQREENRPPVANADSFGVRPGGSIVLPVVANDTDPDGDVLLAEPVDQPGIGTVTPIRDGTALQIDVNPDATGTAAFTYKVNDGRENGEATAQVSLEVHEPGRNEGPVPENEQVPRVTIAPGATVPFNVLPHFRDPDGDDFFLASATIDSPDDKVTFRPDGMVTFHDAGLTTGDKPVKLTFRDVEGATSTSEVQFAVDPARELEPVSTPDHLSFVAGRTAPLKPLLNDLNPTGEDLELLHVTSADGLTVEPDTRAGTVDISSESPGTRYLGYQTGAGALSVKGLIRVDVLPPSEAAVQPVPVDDLAMVTSGGSVLLDPIENDVDPTGGVLVVNSAQAPAESGLKVEVLSHHLMRVTAGPATQLGSAPIELSYDVSNGSGTSTGTVRLMVVTPETQMPYPVAIDDEALVRAGDVVKIAVLGNDESPSGMPLTLDGIVDDSALAGKGTVEISEDQVRFLAAPGISGDVSFVYGISDDSGRTASATATVRIVPEEDPNEPPQPDNGEARAVAGTTVRIPVVTSDIDPDGDSTLLTSILSPAPSLGRVVKASGEWIEYEAFPGSSGTDHVTYQVMDAQGAVGSAQIDVGVAPVSSQNLPPVTTADTIHARPDRNLQMLVLANDSDPEGEPLTIEKSLTPLDQQLTLVDQGTKARIPSLSTRTPAEPGVYAVGYGASDGQNRAPGSATVIVDQDAPLLAPLARDDYVDPSEVTGADAETVTVDVLANDQDPDGHVDDLTIALEGAPDGAEVSETGEVRIPVAPGQQRVRYTITDQDDKTSSAFVWVPGSASQAPQWIGEPVQARAGQPVDIDLRDPKQVQVRSGASGVTITDPASARAENSDGGDLVTSASSLRYVAKEGYHGPDTIAVDVTDGKDAADPEGARGTLLIPVEVSSSTNVPPTLRGAVMTVEQGKPAVPLELSRTAEDPDGDQLSFTLGEHAKPAGMTIDLTPAGSLRVTASNATPVGSTVSLPVSVSDGKSDPVSATVDVTVTSTQEAVISTGVDDVVVDAGKDKPVEVLANDSNPFPGKPRTITSVQTVAGNVTGAVSGETVVLTAQAGWHGTATLTYRVNDETGDPSREVTGTIRANVRDVPQAPSAPRIDSVGDGQVVLSFSPGGDNGAPITGYRVVAASGGSVSQQCGATTCTVSGLSNGISYTFQVIAINEVGESQPSNASAAARPDVRPDKPSAPQATRGDGRLDVAWSAPGNRGSAIQRYEMQSMSSSGVVDTRGADAGSAGLSWTGLANGTDYQFRIRAFNGAPEPSDWSEWSRPEHPAGVPKAPTGKPTATRVQDNLGGGVTVTFAAMSADEANGEPITQYVVRSSSGQEMTTEPGKTSVTFQGLDKNQSHTFTYLGVNSVGRGSGSSPASDPVVPFAVPEAPQGVSATAGERSATVTWNRAATNGTDLKQYVITWQGGRTTVGADQTSVTIPGDPGTSYRFRVQADNGYEGGQSALSGESAPVVPYTNPGNPQISASAGACRGDVCPVTFTVRSNGDGSGGGIQRIEWVPSEAGGASWSSPQTVKDGETVTIDAAPGQTVYIEARVINGKDLPSANVRASGTAQSPPRPEIGSTDQQSFGSAVYKAPPGCTSDYCRHVQVKVSGLQPRKAYRISLISTNPVTGQEEEWAVQDRAVAGADGTWSYASQSWAYGHPGVPLYVTVDGQRIGSVMLP